MNNNKKICPICGSDDISKNIKIITLKEPFAEEANIGIIENICHNCGSKGDMFDQNKEKIENTVKDLKQKSVENILNYFIKNKISLTSIEKDLEIPLNTLSKWKNRITETSADGIVLLRFIRLFPWLLEVAENNYDPQKADDIMFKHSLQKLQKIMETKNSHVISKNKYVKEQTLDII